MPNQRGKLEPIRQSVRVDCPIDDAFRLFTERFGDWWPLALHSTAADEAETCEIEPWPGGRIFERTRSGEERNWGSVIECDPPERLSFSWDTGRPGAPGQTVDVQFSADADGTRVTLIHTGWEAAGVAVCALQAHSFSKFVSEQMLVLA